MVATVLVVDDEKNIRRTLRMVLEGSGLSSLEASSAEETLDDLRNPQLFPETPKDKCRADASVGDFGCVPLSMGADHQSERDGNLYIPNNLDLERKSSS